MTKQEIIIQMRRVSDAMIALGEEIITISFWDKEFMKQGIKLCADGIRLRELQSAAEKEENGR